MRRQSLVRRGEGARMHGKDTGRIVQSEYVIGKHARHRRSVVVGVTGPKGGMSGNPAEVIAYRIRMALRVSQRAPVILYDASGRRIGVMDPITRKRTMDP